MNDHEPDILVTDIALRKLSGLELVKKARSESPDIKVIVAFGPYSPKELVEAVEFDVDAFLRLPVDGSRLRGAVMKCARDIAMARRMAQADYSLRQLLDFSRSRQCLWTDSRFPT